MTKATIPGGSCTRALFASAMAFFWLGAAAASEWPQYRGVNTDGSSPDLMNLSWVTNGSNVVWRNSSASNGFSSVVVSQGRAFAMSLKSNGSGGYDEYCVAFNASTGTRLWSARVDAAPQDWDPTGNVYGGDGTSPYDTGDGPRTTPAAKDGRVFALSGSLRLVCLNAIDGSVFWSNDLPNDYGGSPPPSYANGASPCLDDNLLFVNINSSTNDQTLVAFNVADGTEAWSSQNENSTHSTPIVTTIQGVRQVLFATTTGIVAVERNTGNFLWKFTYPFFPISVAMGASPVFYSNIVYCTSAYGRGAAAAQVVFSNETWNVTQLYYKHEAPGLSVYHWSSIWMSPICYGGYIYSLAGQNNGTFLTAPLNCIELSTGNLMWATNNFGMGGIILVNSNLVAITEKGALVLIKPNPNAYTELSRFQAFQFTPTTPGKCWNSPSFSDGHLFVRSTREVINVNVSPPPQLKLLAPTFLNNTQLQLTVSTTTGAPIASNRMTKIEVRGTNTLGPALSNWPKLTNRLVLATNGVARMTNTVSGQSRGFYITVETP
jgi:outer membrane protein assembly factor BamB